MHVWGFTSKIRVTTTKVAIIYKFRTSVPFRNTKTQKHKFCVFSDMNVKHIMCFGACIKHIMCFCVFKKHIICVYEMCFSKHITVCVSVFQTSMTNVQPLELHWFCITQWQTGQCFKYTSTKTQEKNTKTQEKNTKTLDKTQNVFLKNTFVSNFNV